MAFRKGKMQPSSVPGKKAGPNDSFPIGDTKHARLAIGAATRSERAGHISASTAASIKAKARKKLGDKSSRRQPETEAMSSDPAPRKKYTKKDDTPNYTKNMGKPGHVTY